MDLTKKEVKRLRRQVRKRETPVAPAPAPQEETDIFDQITNTKISSTATANSQPYATKLSQINLADPNLKAENVADFNKRAVGSAGLAGLNAANVANKAGASKEVQIGVGVGVPVGIIVVGIVGGIVYYKLTK